MPIMKRFPILVVLFLVLAQEECATAADPVRLPNPCASDAAFSAPREVKPAVHDMLRQPGEVSQAGNPPRMQGELLPAGESATLSLGELEQMAQTNNPAIGQAAARVAALRGNWVQVGLPPNPTAGYLAEEIGDAGTAGKQGGYVGQEFITGGKLRLNRAIVNQEIQRAEQWLAAATISTRTDVRKAYYKALIANEKVNFSETWAQDATQARQALKTLRAGGLQSQMSRVETFPLDILYQSAPVELARARSELQLALQNLSILVGSEVSEQALERIDVHKLPELFDWDERLQNLTTASPETADAEFQISRAQSALQRACAERVPDVSTEFMVQYDNATEDTVTGVRVGLPLPIWNRNQGGIRQAQAELRQAQWNSDRVRDHLKQRYATTFQAYLVARRTVESYTKPLPSDSTPPAEPASPDELTPLQEAAEARSHAQQLFPNELSALEAATVYRGYTEINLQYLDALDAHWAAWVEIEGLLLGNSLADPGR
jgi:outer membrane protein, heavy metal efflux system